MGVNRPLLVIVQDSETQFDAPLYAEMAREDDFVLKVYYTQTRADATDPELGLAPRWDHLTGLHYPHVHQSARGVLDTIQLFWAIHALRPAHVLLSGYYPPSHLLLAMLLRLAGHSIGLRSDNTLEHSDFAGLKGRIKRVLLPPILRLYRCWHPVGRAAEAYLENISGVHRPVFRFPYAADNAWFARESLPWRAHRAAWRVEQDWGEGDVVVLGVLKWHPREDPLTLVRAFVELRGMDPRARLVLVGDGVLRGEVEELLKDHREAVLLPGYVSYSDLPRWYGLADVFVHPARSEPWGVSVNEAMATGLPVVVSEGVGARLDLIVPSESGEVFPVGDAAALAERLRRLAASTELRQAMGEAARVAVATFDYAHTRQAMRAALNYTDAR
jgi:glycosyltransferase involved in cell wall biosynthesis